MQWQEKTTFQIDLTEKAKIIRTPGEKIDVGETTFRIDWRLQEFPLDLEHNRYVLSMYLCIFG